MTSTNDGKDVKSNQTSGQKGKTYYIELYKSLEAGLSGECKLRERTRFLCEAWRRVYTLCQHSVPSTQAHLITWLQRHTSRTVLQTEWQSPTSKDEHAKLDEAINDFISECQNEADVRKAESPPWQRQLVQRGQWFQKILSNPWGHPVLKRLLDSQGDSPTDEEVLEWLKEERGMMFLTRLRQLAASKCDDLALTLASDVMDRVRAQIDIVADVDQVDDSKDKSKPERATSSFAEILKSEAGFTVDVWELLTDLEFVLLLKRDKRLRCIQLAKQTPLRNGCKLVERLHTRLETSPRDKKLWKNAKEVATLIAEVVVARCMVVRACAGSVRSALYCMSRVLARTLPARRLHAEAASLAAPAATARHLHTFAAAIRAELKNTKEMIPFMCELYVRAITAGMNELERLKLKTEMETEARSAEQTLASWFTQLGSLLSTSDRIQCECTLTAFSVHPSPAMYEKIKAAPTLPPVALDHLEPKEVTTSEFGSWANDSRSMTNLVKTSETLNLKQTLHQANVLSTALLTEGESLGLGPELCQDIAVLLSGPRLKTLSWDMDRELLLENCRAYMDRTSGGTRAVTTELKYLNLDPKAFQHLPEEEDDENDMFYGIEKGYEHLVEFQEPEKMWDTAIIDPEMVDSPYASSVECEISTIRRKKKNKNIIKSSDEDSDPLSYMAEAKRKEKKKVRPHSKERSKERRKKKIIEDPLGSRDVSQDSRKELSKKEKKKEKKEKKERKKKDGNQSKPRSLAHLVGMKVTNLGNRYTSSMTDSDYDSQGKSSLNSLNSETTEDVVFDGLYSMDELKSPEQLQNDKMGLMKNNEFAITDGIVAVNERTTNKYDSDSKAMAPHGVVPKATSTGLKMTSQPYLSTVEEEVKRSISRLIDFRRNKQLLNSMGAAPINMNVNTNKPTPTASISLCPNSSPVKYRMPIAIARPESPAPAQISPKVVTIPDIPKMYINKKQSEQMAKHNNEADRYPNATNIVNPTYSAIQFGQPDIERNKILNFTPMNPTIRTDPVADIIRRHSKHFKKISPSPTHVVGDNINQINHVQYVSTAQNAPKPANTTDTVKQKSFQEFLKELQESINAGAGIHSPDKVSPPPSILPKKEIKPMSRPTPLIPASMKIDNKTTPSAKPQTQPNKLDSSLNTFSRLSYMYKNKQCDIKLQQLVNALIEHQDQNLKKTSTSHAIDRVATEQKISRPKCAQAKIETTTQPVNTIPVNKMNHNSLYKKLEKPSTSASQTINTCPMITSILQNNHTNALKASEVKNNLHAKTNLHPLRHESKPSSLSEKDQNDLLLLLRQQNKLNASYSGVNRDVTHNSGQNTHFVQNSTSSNAVSTRINTNAGLPLYIKDMQASKPKKQLSLTGIKVQNCMNVCPKQLVPNTSKTSRNLTKNDSLEHNMKRTEAKADNKFLSKSDVCKIAKTATDWESVMDAILAQKTPSRGPKALDVALNKSSFAKAFSDSLRNHQLLKSNSMGELVGNNVFDLKQVTSPKEAPGVIISVNKSLQNSQCSGTKKASSRKSSTESKHNSKNGSSKTQSNSDVGHVSATKLHSAEAPRKPNHHAPHRKLSSEEMKKQFTCPLPKDKDPFISGIANSDYDLLEELMDDDLRQEIGELSTDEDDYNSSAPNVSKRKNNVTEKRVVNVYNKLSNTLPIAATSPMNLCTNHSRDNKNSATQMQENKMSSVYSTPIRPDPEYVNTKLTSNERNVPLLVNENNSNIQITHKLSTNPPTPIRDERSISDNILPTLDSSNLYIATIPKQGYQNVVVFNTDLAYDAYPVVSSSILSPINNTQQKSYVPETKISNAALYQTAEFTTPIVRSLIIGNCVTAPISVTTNKATSSMPTPEDTLNPASNISDSVNVTDLEKNNVNYSKIDIICPSANDQQTLPIDNNVPENKINVDFDSNKSCDTELLSDVQEQKLTENNCTNDAEQERLTKKRISIINRKLSHRCDREPIPLSFTPLDEDANSPAEHVPESNPIISQEDHISKITSKLDAMVKTKTLNSETYKSDEHNEFVASESNHSHQEIKAPESDCRRILLRSSNKLHDQLIISKHVSKKTHRNKPKKGDVTPDKLQPILQSVEKETPKPRTRKRVSKKSSNSAKTNEYNATSKKEKKSKKSKGVVKCRKKINKKAMQHLNTSTNFESLDIEDEISGSIIPRFFGSNNNISNASVIDKVDPQGSSTGLDNIDGIEGHVQRGPKPLEAELFDDLTQFSCDTVSFENIIQEKALLSSDFHRENTASSIPVLTSTDIETVLEKEKLPTNNKLSTKSNIPLNSKQLSEVKEHSQNADVSNATAKTQGSASVLSLDKDQPQFFKQVISEIELSKANSQKNVTEVNQKQISNTVECNETIKVIERQPTLDKVECIEITEKVNQKQTSDNIEKEVSKELKQKETSNKVERKEIIKMLKQNQISGEVEQKKITEEVKQSQISDEIERKEIAEEIKQQISDEVERKEIAEEIKQQISEEVKQKQISDEADSKEIIEETKQKPMTEINNKSILEAVKSPETTKEGNHNQNFDAVEQKKFTDFKENHITQEITNKLNKNDIVQQEIADMVKHKLTTDGQRKKITNDKDEMQQIIIDDEIEQIKVVDNALPKTVEKKSTSERSSKNDSASNNYLGVKLADAIPSKTSSRKFISFKTNGNSESEICQSYKDNIKIEPIPGGSKDPLKQCVRIKLPNGRTFKATVHGKMLNNVDKLFEQPELKKMLLSSLTEKKFYTLNIKQVSTASVDNPNKIVETRIQEINIEPKTAPNLVETINLLSDDEDEEVLQYFNTEFGKYKIRPFSNRIFANHQKKLNQKCRVDLMRLNMTNYNETIDMSNNALFKNIFSKRIYPTSINSMKRKLRRNPIPTKKMSALIQESAEVIHIDDSSNESFAVTQSTSLVDVKKDEQTESLGESKYSNMNCYVKLVRCDDLVKKYETQKALNTKCYVDLVRIDSPNLDNVRSKYLDVDDDENDSCSGVTNGRTSPVMEAFESIVKLYENTKLKININQTVLYEERDTYLCNSLWLETKRMISECAIKHVTRSGIRYLELVDTDLNKNVYAGSNQIHSPPNLKMLVLKYFQNGPVLNYSYSSYKRNVPICPSVSTLYLLKRKLNIDDNALPHKISKLNTIDESTVKQNQIKGIQKSCGTINILTSTEYIEDKEMMSMEIPVKNREENNILLQNAPDDKMDCIVSIENKKQEFDQENAINDAVTSYDLKVNSDESRSSNTSVNSKSEKFGDTLLTDVNEAITVAISQTDSKNSKNLGLKSFNNMKIDIDHIKIALPVSNICDKMVILEDSNSLTEYNNSDNGFMQRGIKSITNNEITICERNVKDRTDLADVEPPKEITDTVAVLNYSENTTTSTQDNKINNTFVISNYESTEICSENEKTSADTQELKEMDQNAVETSKCASVIYIEDKLLEQDKHSANNGLCHNMSDNCENVIDISNKPFETLKLLVDKIETKFQSVTEETKKLKLSEPYAIVDDKTDIVPEEKNNYHDSLSVQEKLLDLVTEECDIDIPYKIIKTSNRVLNGPYSIPDNKSEKPHKTLQETITNKLNIFEILTTEANFEEKNCFTDYDNDSPKISIESSNFKLTATSSEFVNASKKLPFALELSLINEENNYHKKTREIEAVNDDNDMTILMKPVETSNCELIEIDVMAENIIAKAQEPLEIIQHIIDEYKSDTIKTENNNCHEMVGIKHCDTSNLNHSLETQVIETQLKTIQHTIDENKSDARKSENNDYHEMIDGKDYDTKNCGYATRNSNEVLETQVAESHVGSKNIISVAHEILDTKIYNRTEMKHKSSNKVYKDTDETPINVKYGITMEDSDNSKGKTNEVLETQFKSEDIMVVDAHGTVETTNQNKIEENEAGVPKEKSNDFYHYDTVEENMDIDNEHVTSNKLPETLNSDISKTYLQSENIFVQGHEELETSSIIINQSSNIQTVETNKVDVTEDQKHNGCKSPIDVNCCNTETKNSNISTIDDEITMTHSESEKLIVEILEELKTADNNIEEENKADVIEDISVRDKTLTNVKTDTVLENHDSNVNISNYGVIESHSELKNLIVDAQQELKITDQNIMEESKTYVTEQETNNYNETLAMKNYNTVLENSDNQTSISIGPRETSDCEVGDIHTESENMVVDVLEESGPSYMKILEHKNETEVKINQHNGIPIIVKQREFVLENCDNNTGISNEPIKFFNCELTETHLRSENMIIETQKAPKSVIQNMGEKNKTDRMENVNVPDKISKDVGRDKMVKYTSKSTRNAMSLLKILQHKINETSFGSDNTCTKAQETTNQYTLEENKSDVQEKEHNYHVESSIDLEHFEIVVESSEDDPCNSQPVEIVDDEVVDFHPKLEISIEKPPIQNDFKDNKSTESKCNDLGISTVRLSHCELVNFENDKGAVHEKGKHQEIIENVNNNENAHQDFGVVQNICGGDSEGNNINDEHKIIVIDDHDYVDDLPKTIIGSVKILESVSGSSENEYSDIHGTKQATSIHEVCNADDTVFSLLMPKHTYKKRCKFQDRTNSYERKSKRIVKRKGDMTDFKFNEKKYRKGKNIDSPKRVFSPEIATTYSKEYKGLFDYNSSVKFSYSRPFHKEHIEVHELLKNWPITTNTPLENQTENEPEGLLFLDLESIEMSTNRTSESLADELLCKDEVNNNSDEIKETNFNMGFGERSGRVILNLEDGVDVFDVSAATLSDVKHNQPVLQSENKDIFFNSQNCVSCKDKPKNGLVESINLYYTSVQLKNKVKDFFNKSAIELNLMQDYGKGSKGCDNYDMMEFLLGLNFIDFINPPPVEFTVQVVQVGQLPVSAAAQNPVTCDPRVTQVSDASPPQCSAENSPHDDQQMTIKTEYTELTTADITLPMVHEYEHHEQSIPYECQESSNIPIINENIPIQTEIKSVVKIELMEEEGDKMESNDMSDHNECDTPDEEIVNHVDYSFEVNTNASPEPPPNMEIMYSGKQCNGTEEFSTLPQENGLQEKTDQIAHAMNAAGISTTGESLSNSDARDHDYNMICENANQDAPLTNGNDSYPKSPSINAMALQQALAQILPPPLNQNSLENNQQSQNAITSQVLHIVQGKNTSGNQVTLVDNAQTSVINSPNATPVLHIVQNKSASTSASSSGAPAVQGNSFSGLSLVDAALQKGGNQLLHIVNAGNQNNNAGQLLKRVNLLTNLTNAQGGNEQKMVQFVCKSADGKPIQLNTSQQRSMVLRLQPVETPTIQTNPTKSTENSELSPSNNTNSNNDSSQEIKSRSVYEENYAKFIQSGSTQGSEKSTSLPKFNQAFGKQVFQEDKQNELNGNSHLSSVSPDSENPECPSQGNALNLDHMGQINSPPLLLRKSPPQTTQSQPNIVQQIKETIAPMNIQTMHGGVIYTRQIPVNIGGGQTINLITVPTTELVDESGQKQQTEVKFINQSGIEPSIIKIVPQTQPPTNGEASQENNSHASGSNENNHNPQPQPVLTQMRIKLPMLSKAPNMVSGARVIRPSFFHIQRNVIGGPNQQVYQQLVLTTAPQLGQQTIRLPQAQNVRPHKTPENQSTSESQMSTSTLEQLREFDLVLEQVKERSTVQPNGNAGAFSKINTSSTDTTDSAANASSTTTEPTQQQVLYSIGNTQPLNVAYVNRKTPAPTPTTSTYVRSPDSSGIVDSSTSSSSSQASTSHPVTTEARTNDPPPHPKKSHKSKSRPKASSNPPNTLKLHTAPPKPSSQKPLEDEQTTQRILYILAEYKEQVENSPDKDKPAPRRRNNLPTTPSGHSKRKKSSGSRRHGPRDMSPIHGDETCRTMGSEDSSCGTSLGDCNESCIDSHSPQDSPRKVARKLTFENEPHITQPRPQPQRNVIVADGQTITVARGTAGKPTTAVLMPTNYILPVSMVKGGQQIAIVTNRGPKLLTVSSGGEGGTTNALLLQRLIGPAGLKPVLTRPGFRHVRLPAAALHNLQAFNLTTAATVQPPDSTASPAPAPTPPDLVDTRAASSPWTDRESQDVKPERGSSPEGTEPWNLHSIDPHDYSYEETVRTENMDRTVLVVHKRDGHRQHRLTHVSAAALRHKYAILEHELRLQCKDAKSNSHSSHFAPIRDRINTIIKSLSEECEDLGVDSPSASDLFPEAELLFTASPAHDHAQEHAHSSQPIIHIPKPDLEDQIATDRLISRDVHERHERSDLSIGLEDVGIVTVSGDGMQATIALDHEEFARAHPNTTFHSEPTDEGEVQPFTITGLKSRHITSTIFHANRGPGTVLVTAPQTTVISQATAEPAPPTTTLKYADIENMIDSLPGAHNNINLPSVLVKDDGLSRFDSLLADSREVHIANTTSAIVHSGNATQVIRRVCFDDDKREKDGKYLIDEPDAMMDDSKMEDISRDAALGLRDDVDNQSSPERHAELFWDSSSMAERMERRRRLDFSSDSDKCCKSPTFDEANSDSGVGVHMRLDSVIKEARVVERTIDGPSVEESHPPLRTYPPKRLYHNTETEVERSISGKTRAPVRSPDIMEVRRRASVRGVVKRGCHCCNGSPAPPRPKKPRPKKPTMDFANN